MRVSSGASVNVCAVAFVRRLSAGKRADGLRRGIRGMGMVGGGPWGGAWGGRGLPPGRQGWGGGRKGMGMGMGSGLPMA